MAIPQQVKDRDTFLKLINFFRRNAHINTVDYYFNNRRVGLSDIDLNEFFASETIHPEMDFTFNLRESNDPVGIDFTATLQTTRKGKELKIFLSSYIKLDKEDLKGLPKGWD